MYYRLNRVNSIHITEFSVIFLIISSNNVSVTLSDFSMLQKGKLEIAKNGPSIFFIVTSHYLKHYLTRKSLVQSHQCHKCVHVFQDGEHS